MVNADESLLETFHNAVTKTIAAKLNSATFFSFAILFFLKLTFLNLNKN